MLFVNLLILVELLTITVYNDLRREVMLFVNLLILVELYIILLYVLFI
jgi:hypothetical protein